MPYPPALVDPMREELTRLGVEELRDAEAVDRAMEESKDDSLFVVVNSVCGCAAANARPAVNLAQQSDTQPDKYATVFAGQDLEATERLRSEYLQGVPPSSPFFALFKGGEPVFVVERRQIEGRSANAIAADVVQAFETYCGNGQNAGEKTTESEATSGAPSAAQSGNSERSSKEENKSENGTPSTFRSITK